MKRIIILFAASLIAAGGCRNQDQSLTADVEIPVSVQDLKLKPIEEYVNTTGTAFPKGEIELKSKIAADYFLESNPRTGRRPGQQGEPDSTAGGSGICELGQDGNKSAEPGAHGK